MAWKTGTKVIHRAQRGWGVGVIVQIADEGRRLAVRFAGREGVTVVSGRDPALVEVPADTPIEKAAAGSPLDALAAGEHGPATAFALRTRVARLEALRRADSLGALLSSRVHVLPHQVGAAGRILSDRLPRFVLADEVGLGKTVEAGLVFAGHAPARHRRARARRRPRAPRLPVARGALPQVQRALLAPHARADRRARRRGGRARALAARDRLPRGAPRRPGPRRRRRRDPVRPRRRGRGAPPRRRRAPRRASRRSAARPTACSSSPRRRCASIRASTSGCSRSSSRCPRPRSTSSSPGSSSTRPTPTSRAGSSRAAPTPRRSRALRALAPGDELFMREDPVPDRAELLSHLADRYSLSARLIRNRRVKVGAFTARVLRRKDVAEGEKRAALVELCARLAKGGEKVLVFGHDLELLRELQAGIGGAGLEALLYDDAPSLEGRDRLVARFRDPEGPMVLLSGESGGEGRNFQFAEPARLRRPPRVAARARAAHRPARPARPAPARRDPPRRRAGRGGVPRRPLREGDRHLRGAGGRPRRRARLAARRSWRRSAASAPTARARPSARTSPRASPQPAGRSTRATRSSTSAPPRCPSSRAS